MGVRKSADDQRKKTDNKKAEKKAEFHYLQINLIIVNCQSVEVKGEEVVYLNY